ncbi:IS4 family transposase [Bremerella volcania]|uniref:IS4 family transposase n=1 Tax=Bremerella volcania TaxID=2527984 RepID=UPI0013FD00E6|nr:IS4 family transposase [Bremerella volcania]
MPAQWVKTITKVRQRPSPRAPKINATTMTLEEFVKHLGGLGGHLGRKCDGRPGWQTLWRGLEKLLLILRGCEILRTKCG